MYTRRASSFVGLVLLIVGGCDRAAPDDSTAQKSTIICGPRCYRGGAVGRLDLDESCRRSYGAAYKAVLPNVSDASSWQCQKGSASLPLMFDIGCVEQYGAGSTPVLSNFADPRSWGCTQPQVDHCAAPGGSGVVTLEPPIAAGIASAAGYEVYGEPALWTVKARTNQFTPNPNPNADLFTPLGWDGYTYDFALGNATESTYMLGTEAIATTSPTTRSITLDTPCGKLAAQTWPLQRVYPTASPVPKIAITSGATYVWPNTAVTLAVTIDPSHFTPTTCTSNARLRLVGKQDDGTVVLDAVYDASFYTKTVTVNPLYTTEYTATVYCNLNKSLNASDKVTVSVYSGGYKCPDGSSPPQYWFCRDCPYNTPPLTNTLVATACTYDEAQKLAFTTSFGGTCNIADGKCPSCPNPNDCGF